MIYKAFKYSLFTSHLHNTNAFISLLFTIYDLIPKKATE